MTSLATPSPSLNQRFRRTLADFQTQGWERHAYDGAALADRQGQAEAVATARSADQRRHAAEEAIQDRQRGDQGHNERQRRQEDWLRQNRPDLYDRQLDSEAALRLVLRLTGMDPKSIGNAIVMQAMAASLAGPVGPLIAGLLPQIPTQTVADLKAAWVAAKHIQDILDILNGPERSEDQERGFLPKL